MGNLFTKFHQFTSARKFGFSVVLIVLVLFSGYILSTIQLREDITAIVPQDQRITRISDVLANSKFADRLIITISLTDSNLSKPESLISAAEYLYGFLTHDTSHIRNIQFKNSGEAYFQVYDFFYEHLPFYLTEADYSAIESKLHADSIAKTMEANYKSLTSLIGLVTKDFIFKDPLSLTQFGLRKLESFQLDDNFTLYNNCIFTKDLKNLLIFVEPVFASGNTKENTKLISAIDRSIQDTQQKFNNINIDYYGGTAVAVSNATVIKQDIIITVSVALVLLMLLFFIIFRKIKHILLIFMPILLGMLFALSLLVIIGKDISAISLGIGAILIGISLDYSLHAFTHFRSMGSMSQALKSIAMPVIMSSLTTASAFLCLYVVKSEALNQLGLFAALAIVITALVVLLVVPAFFSTKTQDTKDNIRTTFLDRIASFSFDKNKILIWGIFILSVFFYFTSKKLGFNSDLNTLNYMSEDLKSAEEHLQSISSETSSAVYFVVQDESYSKILEKTAQNIHHLERCMTEGIIRSYSSPVQLVIPIDVQQQRIERWNEFWNSIDQDKVKQTIREQSNRFHFRAEAFNDFFKLIDKEFQVIDYGEFKPLTEIFLSNYLTQNDSIYSSITIVKADQQKKNELFEKFSTNEDFIIFDNQHFTNQFFDILKEDFNLLVLISIILVFSILLVFFGRIEIAMITFIPVIISWLWTIGIMGLLGIRFNIFNIIISTFILGLGVDYSIFIMSGLIRNYKYGSNNISPYKLSVLLSAITTIIALGVLIFARHPALRSIAFVSIAGIFSVIFITFTILPLLFNFMIHNKGKKRSQPVTLFNFLITLSAFFLYFIGTVSITLFIPIIYILPFRRKIKKLIVCSMICYTLRFFVYVNFTFKKVFINKNKVDFSKPSVIVANHQSHMDLVLMLMLHPKIIAFTNKWVWNSPFYGMPIRYAEYYPSFKGIDHNFELLRHKVNEGYSILVFPEGKRTTDGKIGRMHQGAFYVADKLNLEIQPVIIHGVRQLLEKHELFLKSGQVSMAFYDRIKPHHIDPDKNETYRPQARKLTEFYRTEYDKIRNRIETPEYFRTSLISQYIYKGPILEWYMRIKLRLENNYSFFHNIIPQTCTITDIGCGYGFMSHMLGLLSQGRQITGIDYDENKIKIAAHCFQNQDKIQFIHADIFDVKIEKQDVFILSDVIHYINPEKQEKLILKCIANLNTGGILIIRDADSGMKKRHLGTRYTEFFSTSTGFNKMGEGKLHFTSLERILQIVSSIGMEAEVVDKTKFTSNVIVIIRNKKSDEN